MNALGNPYDRTYECAMRLIVKRNRSSKGSLISFNAYNTALYVAMAEEMPCELHSL